MAFTFKKLNSEISKYKPMKVVHHQRTIPSYFKTDEVEKDMLNDEYNIKIGSALVNNFKGCIDWMFFKSYSMSEFASNRKVKVMNLAKDTQESIAHKPGRATMVFISNVKSAELIRLCNNANSSNTWPELYFVPLFGENGMTNAISEPIVNYYLNRYPDKHLVIFAKQIGSRSFSIPQVDNICIMISDPSFSSAIQKMNRNQTSDLNFSNKVANVYWYNLKNLTMELCPLFEVIKAMHIYASNNDFKKLFIDTADIFIEVDGEEMAFKKLSGNPYEEYLKTTASTFYRASQTFEYLTTPSERDEICDLFNLLKGVDLTGVKGTKMTSATAAKDAERQSDTFEGHTAAKVDADGKKVTREKHQQEVLQRILYIRNTIIAVAMQYNTHEDADINDFMYDFSQLTNNELNPHMYGILTKIYQKLLKCKLLTA